MLARLVDASKVGRRTYGDGVDGLADDTLVGSVGVGGRHVDGYG